MKIARFFLFYKTFSATITVLFLLFLNLFYHKLSKYLLKLFVIIIQCRLVKLIFVELCGKLCEFCDIAI